MMSVPCTEGFVLPRMPRYQEYRASARSNMEWGAHEGIYQPVSRDNQLAKGAQGQVVSVAFTV